jgi:hypothetical protein
MGHWDNNLWPGVRSHKRISWALCLLWLESHLCITTNWVLRNTKSERGGLRQEKWSTYCIGNYRMSYVAWNVKENDEPITPYSIESRRSSQIWASYCFFAFKGIRCVACILMNWRAVDEAKMLWLKNQDVAGRKLVSGSLIGRDFQAMIAPFLVCDMFIVDFFHATGK